MLTFHETSETLAFLAICNYKDSTIKFITANLHLPETMDRVIEAEKIIMADRSTITSDFQNNQALLNTIDKWNKKFKERGPNECLAFLSKLTYKARSVKFITANIHLPKSIERLTETNKIVEANKKILYRNSNKI